jgi:UDP-GlcNAc:undecaprenyl-phosphate GlcNAc-1-phosphate transferase
MNTTTNTNYEEQKQKEDLKEKVSAKTSNPEQSKLERIRIFFKEPKGFLLSFIILFLANAMWNITGLPQNLFLLISSLLLSLILTPSMYELSRILRIVDKPDDRKIHFGEIGRIGGLGVALAFAGAILLSENSFPHKYKIVMIAGAIIALVGLLDDIIGIPAKIRLIVQFFLALWVIDNGISLRLFPTQETWGQILNSSLTIIWIIGFTNAYNFIDGLDGLAAGLGIIVAFFISSISYINGQPEIFSLSSPLIGALFGFLLFNFNPAWIFLGDVGAQFCGFVLSSLAADVAWASPGEYWKVFTLPMLTMWVLLFDMIQITIFRVKYGLVKNISEWLAFTGKDHIHHRLFFIFKNQKKAVISLYIISCVLSLIAVILANLKLKNIEGIISSFLIFTISVLSLFILDKKTAKLAFGQKLKSQ